MTVHIKNNRYRNYLATADSKVPQRMSHYTLLTIIHTIRKTKRKNINNLSTAMS